ncbi:UbiH/UbiF family hydroxylase [Litoreibacter roseus]|uniref:2-octaprenyl-6-methoxyphenyl hydroxylase n=1 Tax=Litoreibacter roseus TaxID=2601869 RepID=A0A6N6JI72_9RHOB|nr:UbiH/UbiF family hydroxylase [Litoreibacter roseus]GFE65966.1 2-octaprenyl-6-methoxyphenyl hydroxylase [Litoreibacter roseus]
MAESFDIIVSGGGVAGLTAACLFGSDGRRVLCVDPTPPVTLRDSEGADLRSTAFLQPSVQVLERAGVWIKLAPFANPLETMRIADAATDGTVRTSRDFNASDISELPFGWNIPNWLIRRELVARLEDLETVDFRPGVATTRMLARTSGAKVWLSEGDPVTADLVIAADGRNSALRQNAGIEVKTTRYGQKALAFAVTHPVPHENVSTEIHRTGGPFTLVPLPDYDGTPSSAVVWMETGAEAQRLFDLDEAAFEAEMSHRSCHVMGPLTLASRRTIWPIISQIADRFSAQRLALVAEAAHVVPPIGAQGLNMSLADLDLLRELSAKHPLGSDAMLQTYDRRRRLDVRFRVTGIDLLNRTSMTDAQWFRDLRRAGIGLIHDAAPVRKTLMQLGLGAR